MRSKGRLNMQKAVRKLLSGVLAAVMLVSSLPDWQVHAETWDAWDGETVSEVGGTGDGEDAPGTEANIIQEYTENCQYVSFALEDDISVTVPDEAGVTVIETEAGEVYRIDMAETLQFAFTAQVAYGYKVEASGGLEDILTKTRERELEDDEWLYRFCMDISGLSTRADEPYEIALTAERDMVSVLVDGEGIVSGVDEDGMAQLGSLVSIELTEPGTTLNLLTRDENGNVIYTAMPLDYDNRYEFVVSEAAEFIISDPEKVSYTVLFANERKAKLTGEAGLKLNGLASSAQGYNEIVLNFTAVPNGSDGTEREKVYYEVQVAATPTEDEKLPKGSSTTPVYYYVPKVENANTQSKSIKVNAGDLSASTACTYEFSVKLVLIANTVSVPAEGKSVASPLRNTLSGNVITKSFSTKNLYYEDKLGFTKKKTSVFTGQENVLVGSVKYSKNTSYIHDLTAVAYDSRGVVCDEIDCVFQNDNDELYVSVDADTMPGKYKLVVYAGIGEEATAGSPQGGTMYQSNTSFTLTVEAGINYINTTKITDRVVLSSKNVTFSAVPVGYCWCGIKAKSQKFTYEIKGAQPDSSGYGYIVTEPTENVTKNISVAKNGKVTVKKGYNVGTANNYTDYIAIVITAADFQGNTTTATKFVAIKGNAQTPSKIYLVNKNGYKLTGDKLAANVVHGAQIVVEDQGGQDMTQYVTITPTDNAKSTAGMYVNQYSSGEAYLYVRSCGKITIKATSKDGKKKTLSLKLEVTKPTFNYLLYSSYPSITSDGFPVSLTNYEWQGGATTATLKYSAPLKKAVISFTTGAKIGGVEYFSSYDDKAYNWFDWAYSITGGTAKVKGNRWTVTPTAKTAELKIWLKTDAQTSKTPQARWTLVFTNDRWGENYESAPKIKLKEGKLYSNKYSNASEVQHHESEWDDYYEIPDQIAVYSYDYLSVRELKWTSVTKNAPYLSVSHDRSNRTLTLSLSAGNDIKAGSYKYKFAFYDEYGYLYCKPMTITVKINKSSAVKLTSSYTMDNSKKGENSVTLKCTPREFLPDFDTKLMNANVGGKANDFNKYFELAYITDSSTGDKQAVIRFKSAVTAREKEELKGKSLTGYVRYSYYYGYDHIENATSKVTIKIK